MMSSERLLYEPLSSIPATLDSEGVRISEQALRHHRSPEESQGLHSKHRQTPAISCFPCSTGENFHASQVKSGLISYKHILWCEPVVSFNDEEDYNQNRLVINYVYPKKDSLSVGSIEVSISSSGSGDSLSVEKLASKIMSAAFAKRTSTPRILVLINPYGGQGKAVQIYNSKIKPILSAAHVEVTYVETQRSQHAIDIALELDVDKYDIIACCSGDGIPHEVINGFFQRPDKGASAFNKIALTQLPCGSGNAFALSSHGTNDASVATLSMLKASECKLDLMALTQKDKTSLTFLSQTYGLIVECDIGTEWMRWMGPKRFEIGTLYSVLTKAKYPCDIYAKFVTQTENELVDHFEAQYNTPQPLPKPLTPENLVPHGPPISSAVPQDWKKLPDSVTSNLNLFYVGKMPYVSDNVQFFPAALPNDHAMDLIVMDTNTPLIETISVLTSADKGKHVQHDDVIHAKVSAYRLVPRLPEGSKHIISVDGESFPLDTFQVEVLPGVLTILLHNDHYVDTSYTA